MNRFQGTNSARQCSMAGLYDNPIPTQFLAPIDCLEIPALEKKWPLRKIFFCTGPTRPAKKGNPLTYTLYTPFALVKESSTSQHSLVLGGEQYGTLNFFWTCPEFHSVILTSYFIRQAMSQEINWWPFSWFSTSWDCTISSESYCFILFFYVSFKEHLFGRQELFFFSIHIFAVGFCWSVCWLFT